MVTSYDPVKYWAKLGKKPIKKRTWFEVQENKLMSLLQNISFESVLEIGCGDGRITSLILENKSIKKYDVIDISSHRLARTKENIEKINTDGVNIQFTQTSFENFQTDNRYDLVIAVEVLMHVSTANISSFIKKMNKFSKTFIVTLDYFPTKGSEWNKMFLRNFFHDYPVIYKTIDNSSLQIFRITNKQAIFYVTKLN